MSPVELSADRVTANRRLASDLASQHLGIRLDHIEPDAVTVSLDVVPWMVNGHGVLHGGILFMLGDSAFAFLSEAADMPSLTRQADITFISPVREIGKITARATLKTVYRRNTIVDVDLTEHGELIGRMCLHGVTLAR